ncbi:MAG: hypothetical protein EA397_00785 [Deltaproteobacteria bacterium]|nr:MAG: hypothetical protein EA397_00785 [Deltaproteobacteria bacterium]
MHELSQLARHAGASALAAEADRLAARVREGRFHVACLGQLKRGKSTLINALLGEKVAPVGVVPITSAVTLFRAGPPSARISTASGEEHEVDPTALEGWVSESANPGNVRGVVRVEVQLASALLAEGLCLIDTPGIGSVFEDHAARTREALPRIDAVLFVIGADPPISGEELALLERAVAEVGAWAVVLNKADRLPADDVRDAITFTERVIEDRLGVRPQVFVVSAVEAEAGEVESRDWPALLDWLRRLSAERRGEIVGRAVERGFRRISGALSAHLRERRTALEAPVGELRARLVALEGCHEVARRSIETLGARLVEEQERVVREVRLRCSAFAERAAPEVLASFEAQAGGLNEGAKWNLRQRALGLAVEAARPVVQAWMDEEVTEVERAFGLASERFAARTNAHLEHLASEGFAASLPNEVELPEHLAGRTRYYFWILAGLDRVTWWAKLVDLFLPRAMVRRRSLALGRSLAIELLEANARRVVRDVDERLSDHRRLVEHRIQGVLRGVVETSVQAHRGAVSAHERGAEAVAEELDEVSALERSIAEISRRHG